MQLNLVNLSKPLRARIDGQSIRAEFADVFPGVPDARRTCRRW